MIETSPKIGIVPVLCHQLSKMLPSHWQVNDSALTITLTTWHQSTVSDDIEQQLLEEHCQFCWLQSTLNHKTTLKLSKQIDKIYLNEFPSREFVNSCIKYEYTENMWRRASPIWHSNNLNKNCNNKQPTEITGNPRLSPS